MVAWSFVGLRYSRSRLRNLERRYTFPHRASTGVGWPSNTNIPPVIGVLAPILAPRHNSALSETIQGLLLLSPDSGSVDMVNYVPAPSDELAMFSISQISVPQPQ